MENGETQANQDSAGEQISNPPAQLILFWSGKSFRGAAGAKSKSQSEPVEYRLNEKPVQAQHNRSAPNEIQQSGLRGPGTFHLFELEFVRPRNDGPPHQLIDRKSVV